MLDKLTAETFKPHIGTSFRIPADDDVPAPLTLELADVVEHAAQEGEPRPAFSLYFTGPGDAMVEQGIYRLEHEADGGLEPMEIFIVPVAVGRYQAVLS